MRKAAVGIVAAAIAAAPVQVLAQEADHTDRGDVADFREHEDGEPEPYEYGPDGMPEPSWSLSLGTPVLLDTNPFWAADGSDSALLVVPSVTLTYSHPALVPGWDLELSANADADVFSRDPDELNEARLLAEATVYHEIGDAGMLSFSFRARWSYIGKDFEEFDQSQQRYVVMFAPNISPDIWASVGAEYRDSTSDSQKRFIGTANFDWTLLDTAKMRLGFFQEFAYSRFTAGANDGRKDLLSLSEVMLTPNLNLPEGMRLGLVATLFHRFSNRDAFRFTAVQLGPSLRFRF